MNGDDLQRAFGRMEAKLDAINNNLVILSKRLDAHSNRLGSLERSRAWLMGIGAALAVLWTSVTAWVFGTRG